MRNNRPKFPEPRSSSLASLNLLPPEEYEDPVPGGSYDDYYTAAAAPRNAVGISSRQIGRTSDPTISNSATGNQSIILGSQNINFTAPVVSLGGRNGLGVNLALSYNSNSVWLRPGSSNHLAFNYDRGIPAPGWRIGFGQLQGSIPFQSTSIPPTLNSELNAHTYTWVEPDGTRRTLVGTVSGGNNIYKSNDSTYIEYNKATGVMRLMDGTQIRFSWATNGSGHAIDNQMLPRRSKTATEITSPSPMACFPTADT